MQLSIEISSFRDTNQNVYKTDAWQFSLERAKQWHKSWKREIESGGEKGQKEREREGR